MSLVTGRRILEELQKLPNLAKKVLNQAEQIKELARAITSGV